jgi:hypothetical protein
MTNVSLILEGFMVISLSPCAPVYQASYSNACDLHLLGLPGQCTGAPFHAKFESQGNHLIPHEIKARPLRGSLCDTLSHIE